MRKSNSTYDSNSAPDSSSDVAKDSGYNSLTDSESDSDSNANFEPIDVERIIQEFKKKESRYPIPVTKPKL